METKADEYIMGNLIKNSPEAPVPIVIPQKEYIVPGGAGNVAINEKIRANVSVGNLGDDTGHKIIQLKR